MGTMPMIMARAVMMTGRKPGGSRLEHGLVGIVEFGHSLLGKGDDQDAVGRGHADAHDRAHQGGHAERRPGEEQHPDNAGQRAGQRHDDDERFRPGLEIDDHEQVDENDRPDEALAQALERVVHRLHLAAHGESVSPWALLFARSATILFTAVRNGAEIAVLHVGVDVDDRKDVVMVDRPRLGIARDGREIGEDLGRIGAVHRQVLQVLQRTDIVLGRLDHDVVADAVFGIEPEGRRGLETAAEGIQDGGGDIAAR